MTSVRLIADDLTGALDSAAAFASVIGPIPVGWDTPRLLAPAGSYALSTGTREQTEAKAIAAAERAAPVLRAGPDGFAFLKVDSLLRGHAGAELAATLRTVPFDQVIIAPAVPFQARISRLGRQHLRTGAGWEPVGEDIVASLRRSGLTVTICNPGAIVPAGISFWNSATDEELDAVVAGASQIGGSTLWVGTAGLASALARRLGTAGTTAPTPLRPLLGLIGTDHPVMSAQLGHVAQHHLRLEGAPEIDAARVAAMLTANGVCFVTCDLPPGLERAHATVMIAERFATLCQHIQRPNTLCVSGGETLSALCQSLGISALDVLGEFEPGIPCARLSGGMWDGLTLYSKSGAFGTPDVLTRLIRTSF